MTEHDQNKQDTKGRRRYREKSVAIMFLAWFSRKVRQVCNGAFPFSNQVLGNRCLGHFDSKLQEFPVNSWSTPQGIGKAHPSDQRLDPRIKPRPTLLAAFSGPMTPESFPVPTNNRFWFDDVQCVAPLRAKVLRRAPKTTDQSQKAEAEHAFPSKQPAADEGAGSQRPDRGESGTVKRRNVEESEAIYSSVESKWPIRKTPVKSTRTIKR